jgi:hypothetical protein
MKFNLKNCAYKKKKKKHHIACDLKMQLFCIFKS